jgi:hypothetical protein
MAVEPLREPAGARSPRRHYRPAAASAWAGLETSRNGNELCKLEDDCPDVLVAELGQ